MATTQTTAQGKFTACGTSFSLNYICSGPSCAALNGFPNTTCTGSAEAGLNCNNGVTCPNDSGYTSNFNYTQPNVLVLQSQTVNLGPCGSFDLNSDGTTGGTQSSVVNKGDNSCNSHPISSSSTSSIASESSASSTSSIASESSASSTSLLVSESSTSASTTSPLASPVVSSSISVSETSVTSKSGSTTTHPSSTSPVPFLGAASARHPSMHGIFFCLLLGMFFLIQGTAALAQPDTLFQARAADHLSSPAEVAQLDTRSLDIAAKRALVKKDAQALANTWKQIATVLSDYVGGVLNTTTGPNKGLFEENFVAEIDNAICTNFAGTAIDATLGADLIVACTSAILTGSTLDAPAEFVAVFTAGVACNYAVSFLFSNTTSLSDITGFVNILCMQPKPCGDLLNDSNNCGACGNVCASGICKNGACTSQACTGETCSTYGPCGPGGNCVCASTSEGTGFCVDGTTQCESLATCTDSTQCGSGEICAIGSCCPNNVCIGATFCGGSGGSNTTSKFLFNRDYGNAMIAHPGLFAP